MSKWGVRASRCLTLSFVLTKFCCWICELTSLACLALRQMWRHYYRLWIRKNWYADLEQATCLTPCSTTHLVNVTETRHTTVQIPLSLWKTNVRCRIQNPPPTVLISIQTTPDHALPPMCLRPILILSSQILIVCKVLLPFTFLVHNRHPAIGLVSKLPTRSSWIRFPTEEIIFLTAKSSRPNLPPFQWVWGIISLEVKQPGREADHWIPFSAWRAQGYF